MGTFVGHVLPGSFFISFAIWWSFTTTLRYLESRKISLKHKTPVIKYKSSVAMSCGSTWIKFIPLDSGIKLLATTFGMVSEIYGGLYYGTAWSINTDDKAATNDSVLTHDHGHHMREVNSKAEILSWHFQGGSAQHTTMYAGFFICAIVEILIHFNVHLPERLDHICLSLAYIIEGLLFQYHLDGRDPLDVQLHVLLVISIYACAVTSIFEYARSDNVIFTYGRIAFTFLQGTWLIEIAFILYPPIESLENRWSSTDHMSIMFVTMSFIWHFLFIFLALLAQFIILNRLCSTKYSANYDLEDSQQNLLMNENDHFSDQNNENNHLNEDF